MKKIILLLGALLFVSASSFALPWGHRYAAEQPDSIVEAIVGVPFTMSVEWGEGGWEQSKLGYGSSQDGTDWIWVDIDWFENDPLDDQDDSGNKRCKVDVTIMTPGTYFYAYKFVKSGDSFQYGSDGWLQNAVWNTASVVSFITVKSVYFGAISAPTTAIVSVDSIALNAVEGYEYAIILAGGDVLDLIFQDDTVFNDLEENTSYDIYQRVKETEMTYASVLSEKLSVATPLITQLQNVENSFYEVMVNNRMVQMTVNSGLSQPATVTLISLSGKVQSLNSYSLMAGENTIDLP